MANELSFDCEPLNFKINSLFLRSLDSIARVCKFSDLFILGKISKKMTSIGILSVDQNQCLLIELKLYKLVSL